MNPFLVLGVPATMDLDDAELEQRYVALARECHPDHHATGDAAEQLEQLRRAARLNDAYRIVKDPWRRAQALLELSEPGILERTKQLCPTFLLEAIDLAEAASHSDGAAAIALRSRLQEALVRYRRALSRAVAERRWTEAATNLHEARYYRKALADLEARV